MSDKRKTKKKLRVCYFGIYDPKFSRNVIYMRGLRKNGAKVIECNDRSSGIVKYWKLFRKHWKIRKDYDVLVVGYQGQIVVPFAKLLSRKPVMLDALCSLYESLILSRDAYKGNPLRVPVVRFIDWLAYACADKILVETEKQKEYFIEKLNVSSTKLAVLYTGVDDKEFFADEQVKKFPTFTVLFRGRIVREAGVSYVLKAAKVLEERGVDFLIIGYGWDDAMREFEKTIKQLSPKNVKYIGRQVPFGELRQYMQQCQVSLGQFGDSERLSRTIPHKAFEALVMRLPYVTARAQGIREVLYDGENCLMVNPADADDLADKILMLKNNKELREKLLNNGYNLYEKRFTPVVLGKDIIQALESLTRGS